MRAPSNHLPAVVRRTLGEARPDPRVERYIIDGALEKIRRQKHHRRYSVAASIAATFAAVVLVCLFLKPTPRPPQSQHATVKHDKKIESSFKRTVWSTANQVRNVTFGPHRLQLGPHSQLQLQSAAKTSITMKVLRGRAAFKVKKLPPQRTFEVLTDHLRVVVVGTRFSVETDERCSRVVVAQGVVEVVTPGNPPHMLTNGEEDLVCRSPQKEEIQTEEEKLFLQAMQALLDDHNLNKGEALLQRYLISYPQGDFIEDAYLNLIATHFRLGEEEKADRVSHVFFKRFQRSPNTRVIQRWQKNHQVQSRKKFSGR